ncbi:MAG: hypothetical protein RIQ47_443 [Bacteroidota bacterium]
MKKVQFYVLAIISTVVVSCTRNEIQDINVGAGNILEQKSNPLPVPGDPLLSRQDLDALIVGQYQDQQSFTWSDVDLHTLCSAADAAGLIVVGYQPANAKDIDSYIERINLQSTEWKSVHDALLNLVIDVLRSKGQEIEIADLLEEDDATLPLFVLRTTDKDVITQLYNLKNVRYVEPYGYWPNTWAARSSSGCDNSTEPLNTSDWTTVTPASLLPWNYNNVNVPAAWNVAQGEGIRIGVIDAGLSSSQSLLGSQFNDGLSNVGRTITTDYTLGTSAYTSCTHGTSMCGVAAGPRNAQNATTGIAYKSSLHFIRACNDVVLDQSSELTGTKNALTRMGNLNNIRVISMSIGTPFSSSALRDGVTYAYNKGKLIMAAAGTSFSATSWWGVIYPAAYSQCVAVTGVKENGSRCASCHDGSAVMFTIPMERDANSSRNSLSLKPSLSTPSYIGGSSVATATAAGIAALVYSAKPTLTRAQVVDILQRTSQFYPTRTSTKGFGNMNASAAVNLALTY